MARGIYIFALILLCFALGCRSGMLSHLVAAQEWSENYALLEGTTCTYSSGNSQIPVPELIDGNLETIGQSGHRIIISLPSRKSIHRIVIRGTNIEDLLVYEGLGGEREWKKIHQVKNNSETTLDVRVRTVTEQIRLVVGGTFDDQRVAGAYSAEYNAIRNRQVKRGRPIAQEIELYGFADKPK